MRLERFHSQELGLKFGGVPGAPLDSVDTSISDALELHIRLKCVGKLEDAWKARNTKVLGVSVDSIADHKK